MRNITRYIISALSILCIPIVFWGVFRTGFMRLGLQKVQRGFLCAFLISATVFAEAGKPGNLEGRVIIGDSSSLSFESLKQVINGAPIKLSLTRMGRAENSMVHAASLGPVYGVNRALGANFSEYIPLSYAGDPLEISPFSQKVSSYVNLNFLGSNDVSSDSSIYACTNDSKLSEQAYRDARAVSLVALSRMSRGNMGTGSGMAERVASMLNQGILPMVPRLKHGDSLGSGDAVPMAVWLRSAYDYEGSRIKLPHAQDPQGKGFPTDNTACFVRLNSPKALKKSAVNKLFPPATFVGADASSILSSNAYTIGLLVQLLVQNEVMLDAYAVLPSGLKGEARDPLSVNKYAEALKEFRETLMLFVNSSGGASLVVPELNSVDVGAGPGSVSALTASFDDTTVLAASLERFMLYFGDALLKQFETSSSAGQHALITKIRMLIQPNNRGETIDGFIGDHSPYTTNLALNLSRMIEIASLGESYKFSNYQNSDLDKVYSVSLTLNGVQSDIVRALGEEPSGARSLSIQSFKRSLDLKVSGDREKLMKQIAILQTLSALGDYSFRALRDYELAVFDGPKYLSIHPRNYGVAQYERVMAFHLDKLRSLSQVTGFVQAEKDTGENLSAATNPVDYSALLVAANDAVSDAIEHYRVLAAGELIVAAQLTELGGKYSAFNLTGYLLELMDGTRSPAFKTFYGRLRSVLPFTEWDAGSVEGGDRSRLSHHLSSLISEIEAGEYGHVNFGYPATEPQNIHAWGKLKQSVNTLANDCSPEACSKALGDLKADLVLIKTEEGRVEYTHRLNALKPLLSLKIPNVRNRVRAIPQGGASPIAFPYQNDGMRQYTHINGTSAGIRIAQNSAESAYRDVEILLDLMGTAPPRSVSAKMADKEAALAYKSLKGLEDGIINLIGLSFSAKNSNNMAYDQNIRFRENDQKYGRVPVTDTMHEIAQKITRAMGNDSYLNKSSVKDYPTLSVENPQHRAMLDNRSFRDVVSILADYHDAVARLGQGSIHALDYQRVNQAIERQAQQAWVRIHALLYRNGMHDVGFELDVDKLFATDSKKEGDSVMPALYLTTLGRIRALTQLQYLDVDSRVNVYHSAKSIQESIGLLKKLFAMEVLVSKNIIAARREYFSTYGKISMGSSGTDKIFKAIKNSSSCSMSKPLAYSDFSKCSDKVIFK